MSNKIEQKNNNIDTKKINAISTIITSIIFIVIAIFIVRFIYNTFNKASLDINYKVDGITGKTKITSINGKETDNILDNVLSWFGFTIDNN